MVTIILLFIAIILILALFAINISDTYGIPSLLLFLVLGIVCKFLGIQFQNYEVAESFSTLALMVIMFYGGFGTNWSMGKPVVKEAVVLSSLGVVSTALLTGLFAHYLLGFSMLEGMLLGSIVGSTDYASVSNILSSKNLNLKYNTSPLLELESGSNDPTAYSMTMLFLSLIAGTNVSVPILIARQVIIGVGLGFLLAIGVKKILEKINLNKDGLAIVFMAAMALLTYSLTAILGGNGYLAVYLFGIYVGNQHFLGKRDVVFFFDGATELMNIGLFFLLGLLSEPVQILSALPVALLIMLFMTFIARPLSVFGLTFPFRLKLNQLLTISWAGLRGAAAIAFAIMVVNSDISFINDIYHIVFGICFLSSLFQGSLMPWVARKTDMLDPNDTVLKTFNYYQDKSDISFLQTKICKGSNLAGTMVKDLNLTFDFIVAKIKRDNKTIVPRGEVVLEEGDTIVLGGEEYFDPMGKDLVEFTITSSHPWVNQKIVDLNLPSDILILMIQRADSEIVVAAGDTVILEGDRIILISDENVDFEERRPEG